MSNKITKEVLIINITTLVCFLFGIAGVVISILTASTAMLFDGLYSLIQSVFILLSGFVVKLLTKGDDEKYQFGYGAFEPFFIVVRVVVLLTVNYVLLYTAIKAMFTGGYDVDSGPVIIYAIISIASCMVVATILNIASKKFKSPILKTESQSWVTDGLISTGVLVSFVIMTFIDSSNPIVRYIDPFVSIILIVGVSPPLWKNMITNTKELLEAAPPVEIREKIDNIVASFVIKYNFKSFNVFSSKRGRVISIVIHIFIKKEKKVEELDQNRMEILQSLKDEFPFSDIDIVFSIDPSWVTLASSAVDMDALEEMQGEEY